MADEEIYQNGEEGREGGRERKWRKKKSAKEIESIVQKRIKLCRSADVLSFRNLSRGSFARSLGAFAFFPPLPFLTRLKAKKCRTRGDSWWRAKKGS